jgi:predicted nucleic acid-binding protein
LRNGKQSILGKRHKGEGRGLTELPNVHSQFVYYKWNLIEADPDDNKYVDSAIAGQAEYLVTEDKHFAALKQISFPQVNTMSIDDFVKKLQEL